tara:strand:- start:25434 stop:25733 length:300 start_codon:yes stop_codon:yes gene_type:complete
MIIYNVTVKIDHSVHQEWLDWMKNNHIQDVIKTGHFVDYKICKILIDDEEGVNYSIQYRCNTMKDLHIYQVHDAVKLQKEHTDKFDGKFVAFRTLLEEL